ncbi:imidazole glycerol phosphate synthase subunit HisH [Parasalinivibrio latis]|uniref:imidazole glycerol phosphate synthase subunit HisH n=1 Tax=Parasalinivibrio latis TaxID=2952610 RepID=UPI0030E455A5
MDNIVIIDTGCANVSSLRFAVERLGYPVTVSRDPDVVLAADKLFLPGVGTATEAMKNLRERDLIDLVKKIDKPVLGICLGMQLLGQDSAEGKDLVPCLGHVPAATRLMETGELPLPHMGWNQVTPQGNHPLFKDIPAGSHFYFVHSYAMPTGTYTIASCEYGNPFSAAVQSGNYYGVQFHPERSSKAGAQLIKNFLEM